MNKNKYVFAQLVEFLDKDKFRHLVDKYNGNRYVKSFTCWNQLLALMFGQLSMHIPADTRSAFPVISVQSPVSIQYRWQS